MNGLQKASECFLTRSIQSVWLCRCVCCELVHCLRWKRFSITSFPLLSVFVNNLALQCGSGPPVSEVCGLLGRGSWSSLVDHIVVSLAGGLHLQQQSTLTAWVFFFFFFPALLIGWWWGTKRLWRGKKQGGHCQGCNPA